MHVDRNMTIIEKRKALHIRAGLPYPSCTYPSYTYPIAALIGRGLLLCLAAASISVQPAAAQTIALVSIPDPAAVSRAHVSGSPAAEAQPAAGRQPRRANFEQEVASQASREMADWVVDSGDNRHKPFVIVDKIQAKVFVFDALGRLRGAAPALLGLAIGDDSVPGIGERKLSSIRPDERTTPAGRFVASLDRNLHGEEILWVDYDAAVSMHRVITSNPKERRAQRLDSPVPLDHRISYGCINVPVKFYNKVLSPAFTGTDGIVYVLPETRSAREVFGSYVVGEHAPLQTASQAAPIPLVFQGAR